MLERLFRGLKRAILSSRKKKETPFRVGSKAPVFGFSELTQTETEPDPGEASLRSNPCSRLPADRLRTTFRSSLVASLRALKMHVVARVGHPAERDGGHPCPPKTRGRNVSGPVVVRRACKVRFRV